MQSVQGSREEVEEPILFVAVSAITGQRLVHSLINVDIDPPPEELTFPCWPPRTPMPCCCWACPARACAARSWTRCARNSTRAAWPRRSPGGTWTTLPPAWSVWPRGRRFPPRAKASSQALVSLMKGLARPESLGFFRATMDLDPWRLAAPSPCPTRRPGATGCADLEAGGPGDVRRRGDRPARRQPPAEAGSPACGRTERRQRQQRLWGRHAHGGPRSPGRVAAPVGRNSGLRREARTGSRAGGNGPEVGATAAAGAGGCRRPRRRDPPGSRRCPRPESARAARRPCRPAPRRGRWRPLRPPPRSTA